MRVTDQGVLRPEIDDPPLPTAFDPNWGLLDDLMRDTVKVVHVDALSTLPAVANLSGINPVIDGVPWPRGSIILLAGQPNKAQNGLWQIPPATGIGWIRPPQFRTGSTHRKRIALIGGGNTYMNTVWMLVNEHLPQIDRDPQFWQMLTGNLIPLPNPVTASGTVSANTFEAIDTTSGAITRTLPANPPDRARVCLKLVIQGGSNAVTIARGGTDSFDVAGNSASLTLTAPGKSITLQYQAFTGIWYGIAAT